ncbi:MAG TPA: HAMP domain-containing protein, partial [Dongiaceae bacterium]|nr:HAMP domain-containing protein [Dongiaceae bacterium]
MLTQRFRAMNVGRRLLMLIAAMTLTIAVIGAASVLALQAASSTVVGLQEQISRGVTLNNIALTVRNQFIDVANRLYRGTLVWADADALILQSRKNMERDWQEYLTSMPEEQQAAAKSRYLDSLLKLYQAYDDMIALGQDQSRGQLELFMLNDLDYLTAPFLATLQQDIASQRDQAAMNFAEFSSRNLGFLLAMLGLFAAGVAGAVFMGWGIRRSIVDPVGQVMQTVQKINDGDYSARSQLPGTDEIAGLANALDSMLDARIRTLVEKEQENDRLNDSIIQLLEATSRLGDRDLTVTVPVSEDITGPIADAMNLVATETSRVLMD